MIVQVSDTSGKYLEEVSDAAGIIRTVVAEKISKIDDVAGGIYEKTFIPLEYTFCYAENISNGMSEKEAATLAGFQVFGSVVGSAYGKEVAGLPGSILGGQLEKKQERRFTIRSENQIIPI